MSMLIAIALNVASNVTTSEINLLLAGAVLRFAKDLVQVYIGSAIP